MVAQKTAIKISVDDDGDEKSLKPAAVRKTPKRTARKSTPKSKATAPKDKPPVRKTLKTVPVKKVSPGGAKPEPVAPRRKSNIVNKIEVEDTADEQTVPGKKLDDISLAHSKTLRKTKVNDIMNEKMVNLLTDKRSVVADVIANEQAAETKGKKEEESPRDTDRVAAVLRPRRSIRMYRKIALSFIFLTIVLLAFIFYFTFIKVTIVLIPNQERISNNMIFDVYDLEREEVDKKNGISGIVKLTSIEKIENIQAEGSEVIGQEAIGKATIFNSYNQNQPLVATTRLLTPAGKLFRIKETVNVPAGGSVEVVIYADDPSPEMAIEPTRLTIPGLWAGLQDKIYAETKEPIVYQEKLKRRISEEDIENGKRDLKGKLLTAAKAEINDTYSDYSQIIYKIDEDSIATEIDGEVGDEVDEFSISMKADVVVVAYSDSEAANLARNKFLSSLPDNKGLISFDDNNIIYTLNSYDYEEGAATINATFEGKVSLKEDAGVIDINKILGLKKSQLDIYLDALPEIAGYEVKFTPTFLPAFLQRVPKLVDKIEIEVKK